MKQKTRDMTQGKPAGIIVSFAIPLMLGNVFQQMYTVMDSVIVGRGVGGRSPGSFGNVRLAQFYCHGRYYRNSPGVFRINCSVFWSKR